MRYLQRPHLQQHHPRQYLLAFWVICAALLVWGAGLHAAAAQDRGRTNRSKSNVEREGSKKDQGRRAARARASRAQERKGRAKQQRSRNVRRDRTSKPSTRRTRRHRSRHQDRDRGAKQRKQTQRRAPAQTRPDRARSGRTRAGRHRRAPKQRSGRPAGVRHRAHPSTRGHGTRYRSKKHARKKHHRKKHVRKKHRGRKYGQKRGRHGRTSAGIFIDIDIVWPWKKRHRARWAPRYEYRQNVAIRAGRGYRTADLDVRTRYHHRIRVATDRYAVVDIVLDEIAIYDRGRFVGAVDRIPGALRSVEATIHRSGRVVFDRDLFLVGDPSVGFELIATPYYRDFVLGAYRAHHQLEVGVLDLYREEVVRVRHSALFRPARGGSVPISLLPKDMGWRAGYAAQRHNTHRRRHYDPPGGARISIEADVWLKRLR